jgi:hypothetical protein
VCFVTVISSVTSCRLPVGPFFDEEHRDRWEQDFRAALESLNSALSQAGQRPAILAAMVQTDYWDALTDREDLLRLWRVEDVVSYIERRYEETHSSNAA